MLIRKLLTPTVTAVMLVAGASGAVAQTLGQALAQAYDNSGLVEQNRALLRAADEDVALAVSALKPIVNWSAAVQRNASTFSSSQTMGVTTDSTSTDASLSVSAELLLYDFGQSRLSIDAAKENVLATRQGLVSVEQSVLLRAVSAFLAVRREAENVRLLQGNVRVLGEELRAARDRFEVGEVTRTDVALAEARLAGSRSSLAAGRGALAQAREEYKVAVGEAPGALQLPRLPRIVENTDEAMQIAMRTHPDILQAQHNVTVAELNLARADAAKRPSVKLRGSYSLSEDIDSDDFSRGGLVSLEASGPIYQGGRLTALSRQAIAARDASRSVLHLTQLNIRQAVGNAFANLQVARARRVASDAQIEAARVAFNGVREEAALGARTTLDVLDAEQELLDASVGRVSAQADEYLATFSVLSSMGLLTADYLNLDVQQYDPAAYYNAVKSAPSAASRQGRQLDRVLRAIGKE